ncbi:TonB-dependent receptor [Pedobacter sp. G11]|nr:TonB-dependent receptor [Pedobacter sp. G11]
MRKILFLFLCLIGAKQLYAQQFQLSGTVLNGQTPVKHATVYIENTLYKTITDEGGKFNFEALPKGSYKLIASAVGYSKTISKVEINGQHVVKNLSINKEIRQLNDVTIKDEHVEDRRKAESMNIEIVNQDFIQRNLGGSLMKSLERLPGIKTIGIGSGQSKPLIRGLGFNRVVVVDKGVKHEGQQWGADHGLEIDQFATGEIELIKGSASFIYGSDAIGGVIDILPVSIPPLNSIGGSVDLIAKSNNNLYGTSTNIYGRNKRWFFDSRFTYQNYGDYRVPTDQVFVYDYAVKLYQNHLRNTAGRETGIHFNTGYVGEKFRSVFYLSNTFAKSGFFANAHGLEPRRVNEDLHDSSNRDILHPYQSVNHFKLINRSSYQLPNQKIEFELGYQKNYRQEFSQYVNHGFMPSTYPATLPIPIDLEREFNKVVYSGNLRDRITINAHELSVGINAEVQTNDINGWSFLVPAFKQKTIGAFVYDKFKITDNLLLHGALRYDRGQINMFQYNDWFPSDITINGLVTQQNLQRAANLNRTFNSLVWSAGLNYNLEKFGLKFNLGKSFRMPIAKELGANGVNYHYFSYEKGNPNLSPEKSYQADLSLAWNDERWSVQLSPFYNYFPNYIYLNPTSEHDYAYGAGNQIFEYAQSSVQRFGGELQLKYEIFKNLSTQFLGEILQAKQLSGNKKGFTLPFSPPASALINLTYSPKTGRQLSNTYFSIDYRLTSKQDNIVPPEKKTPGYQIVNIQAGTKLSLYGNPLQLSLQVQNLFDTKYLNHTSFYRLIELPEAGRNLVLSLKIPFGK